MCIEAWLDGCVERLLGIPVVKVPIFLVRWSYLLCDGSWKNFPPLFCLMFSLYSIECFSLLLSVVSLFFYQLFLSPSSGASLFFSFLSIGYFSFLVVEGCVCFLFTAHFWSRAHILMREPHWTPGCVPVSYVRSALSARSIRDFIAEEWTYLLCQEGEEKESRFLHT